MILCPKPVTHRSADPKRTERFEFETSIKFEAFDRIEKTQESLLHEIVDIDMTGKSGVEPSCSRFAP